MTEEEALATLSRESGIPLRELQALNLYEQRLMLGWTPRKKPLKSKDVSAKGLADFNRQMRAMLNVQAT